MCLVLIGCFASLVLVFAVLLVQREHELNTTISLLEQTVASNQKLVESIVERDNLIYSLCLVISRGESH